MSFTYKPEIRAGKKLFVVIREGGGVVPPPCEFETEGAAAAQAELLNKQLEEWLAKTKDMPRMTEQESRNERIYKTGQVISVFGDEAILNIGRNVYKIGPSLGRKLEQEGLDEEEYKGPSLGR